MAEIVKWSGRGGIAFFVNSHEVRGIKNLSISASAETEEKTSGGQKFTKKKNSGSYQMSMTALFSEGLGTDAQAAAMQIAEAARCGDSGYLYCRSAKLIPARMMMVDAKINNVNMTPKGVWFSCEVAMTLKQCDKYGADSGSGKKKKKKKSAGAGIGKGKGGAQAGLNKGLGEMALKLKDYVQYGFKTTKNAKKKSDEVLEDALRRRRHTGAGGSKRVAMYR